MYAASAPATPGPPPPPHHDALCLPLSRRDFISEPFRGNLAAAAVTGRHSTTRLSQSRGGPRGAPPLVEAEGCFRVSVWFDTRRRFSFVKTTPLYVYIYSARSQWPHALHTSIFDQPEQIRYPVPAGASRSPRPPARVFTHISPRNRLDSEYFTRNSITVKLLPFRVRTLSDSSSRNPHFCYLIPFKRYKEYFLPSLIPIRL